MDDEDDSSRVRYLDEIREPEEGWAQQEQFLRIIEEIDDRRYVFDNEDNPDD